MLGRANKLAHEPEFYNTITNNCANNLVAHVNNVVPRKIPYNYQVLFPGMSDRLVYDMGLIKSSGTFEQTRTRRESIGSRTFTATARIFRSRSGGTRSAERPRVQPR